MASRRRELLFDLNAIDAVHQEINVGDTSSLKTKNNRDNTNGVSDAYNGFIYLSAHLSLASNIQPVPGNMIYGNDDGCMSSVKPQNSSTTTSNVEGTAGIGSSGCGGKSAGETTHVAL